MSPGGVCEECTLQPLLVDNYRWRPPVAAGSRMDGTTACRGGISRIRNATGWALTIVSAMIAICARLHKRLRCDDVEPREHGPDPAVPAGSPPSVISESD